MSAFGDHKKKTPSGEGASLFRLGVNLHLPSECLASFLLNASGADVLGNLLTDTVMTLASKPLNHVGVFPTQLAEASAAHEGEALLLVLFILVDEGFDSCDGDFKHFVSLSLLLPKVYTTIQGSASPTEKNFCDPKKKTPTAKRDKAVGENPSLALL